MEDRRLLNKAEVMEILNTSEATAYKVIRELNAELQEQGYYTISGRVSKKYLLQKFFPE